MTVVLKLKNISKEFSEPRKNIIALENINFSLLTSQCVGLLGPSGSGKTTFLQIAALLDSKSKGEIFINEKRCDNLSQEEKNLIRRKNIGFVYQNFYLLDAFSALENVIIPQLIKKRGGKHNK